MAVVDIKEYASLARDASNAVIPTGAEPSFTNQQVIITAGSIQSNAFNGATQYIRVHTDGAIRFEIGANPTASATSARMAANSTEFFGVKAGHKIAIIQTT